MELDRTPPDAPSEALTGLAALEWDSCQTLENKKLKSFLWPFRKLRLIMTCFHFTWR
jgi:hypothetical protein